MCRHRSHWFLLQINYLNLRKLEKSKSWELFTICLLNGTANIAQLEGIWARLAVLFSRQIASGSHNLELDLNFTGLKPFIRFENN